MIGKSKEFEDDSRVASSFLTYLGKIEATLLAGYMKQFQLFQDVSFGIFQLNRNIALSPVYVILLNLLAEPKF